jgi:transposase-like protein
VDYLTWNDGKKKSQVLCKICQTHFSPTKDNRFTKTNVFKCPHCNHTLEHKKDRKHFIIHKCVNPKCPYYLHNLKKVDKKHLDEAYGKSKYKLHYIYREFTIDFFKMDLNSLPKNASSLKFNKFDKNVMGLCLTYKINLGLSLRKTQQALKDIHGINISHQQIANYCKTAAVCIKPYVDNYNYEVGSVFTADETYIKIRGVKGYIWFIMDAAKRAIIGYRISDNRGVGPCILSMRMAFKHLKELPKNFHFIADGYSAYPLAAQQFYIESEGKTNFEITQVIGLTNDDAVTTKFRPYKQMIERLNRTYKQSYRPTNGFNNIDGANYDLSLWVAYYNFLRPHKHNKFKPPVHCPELDQFNNMPTKWQYLIAMGQLTILNIQNQVTA